MRRDVFQAIADPNRRAILSLLASEKMTINGVADQFKISRPAVSKHMKILVQSGLVRVQKQGRERVCEARLDKLAEVTTWVERYREIWNRRFDALDAYLEEMKSSQKK